MRTAMAPLVPAGTQVLAGLEMGGIAVVTALGQRTGLAAPSNRPQPGSVSTHCSGARISTKREPLLQRMPAHGKRYGWTVGRTMTSPISTESG